MTLLLRAYIFLFISDKWASRSITVETESTCAIALTLFETNRAIVLRLPSVDSLVPAGGSSSAGTVKQIDSVWIHEL